ncbi:hypothetical protein AVEN_103468-1 [Araneus ventricosus]|uniref:Uncharacterized protein n=1 Tax=Araneus ventricosus TaxID=182803 RepID=A0A4Y2MMA4_ARAVE|nr:hypothetical protein AVEN_103468-1 [Araneus ventricosus]
MASLDRISGLYRVYLETHIYSSSVDMDIFPNEPKAPVSPLPTQQLLSTPDVVAFNVRIDDRHVLTWKALPLTNPVEWTSDKFRDFSTRARNK